MKEAKSGKSSDFVLDPEGVLNYSNRLYVNNYEGLREAIFEEAYNSKYSPHMGSVKNVSGSKIAILVGRYEKRCQRLHISLLSMPTN